MGGGSSSPAGTACVRAGCQENVTPSRAQQQAGFFLAFLGRRTDVLGRLRDVLLRLLWNREQFHGLFVVSAETFYLEVGECKGPLLCLPQQAVVAPHCRRCAGSPPPARGGRRHDRQRHLPDRHTPACAGRTSCWSSRRGSASAHPRLCGEHCQHSIENWRVDGSPPLDTPACAGRTPGTTPGPCAAAAHPRLRGEDPVDPWAIDSLVGSPPPAGRIPTTERRRSVTPAHLRLRGPRRCRSHPRQPRPPRPAATHPAFHPPAHPRRRTRHQGTHRLAGHVVRRSRPLPARNHNTTSRLHLTDHSLPWGTAGQASPSSARSRPSSATPWIRKLQIQG